MTLSDEVMRWVVSYYYGYPVSRTELGQRFRSRPGNDRWNPKRLDTVLARLVKQGKLEHEQVKGRRGPAADYYRVKG